LSLLWKDPRGKLPVLVWKAYIKRHGGEWRPVSQLLDRSEPDSRPLKSQAAVDQAVKLLNEEVIDCVVFSGRDPGVHAKAVRAIFRLLKLLTRASSSFRKRGQPATMRPIAVRAYILRKFNSRPKNCAESSISWAKLADLMFADKGKCTRCGVSRHQYEKGCVKALIAAVRRLERAMEQDRMPSTRTTLSMCIRPPVRGGQLRIEY
jgi:hypothetical protein